MKKVPFFLLIIWLLLSTASITGAEPLIEAKIESDAYAVGDIIPVKIEITDNPGFHSLYFDLAYDRSVVAFDSIEQGLFIHRLEPENTLLYGLADNATANAIGGHVVVSFVPEEKTVTKETGTFATIRFRVIGPGDPGESYLFSFDDNGVKDAAGILVAAAEWIDTDSFRIVSSDENAYIHIRAPYENQVFYENQVAVDAIFTDSPDYYVVLENSDTGYRSGHLPGITGSIIAQPVPVEYGFNRLKARLYDQTTGELLAEDTVRILRSGDDIFIKIITPHDHELLNTDMVEVRVSSPFDNVTINRTPAEITGEKAGMNTIYRRRIWLKTGFNTINAACESPDGAVYTDAVTIFYHKDNRIFRFVQPGHGEVFKTGDGVLLPIKGEIGSQYKAEGEPNTVTLKVIYMPDNPLLSPRVLVNNRPALITETDIVTGASTAPYMFLNNFEIPLAGLESGEVEIIAYKNKKGTMWEDEIHRIIKVDSNELSITLVQPNVYSQDILNTLKKLETFNEGILPQLEPLRLTDDGGITLSETNRIARDGDSGGNPVFGDNVVADMIETRDKTLYALVNENFGMKIYAKLFGSDTWEQVLSRDDIYGYDLCETGLGILIGVSNLFTSAYSGLYLLDQERHLINITIGEPIPNVQFIVNHESEIFLYGNDYSHLYSFNIFSLEDDRGSLKTSAVTRTPFNNNLFISQFELSDDGKTALLRDTNNRVSFYENRNGNGFSRVTLDPGKFDPFGGYIRVVRGSYTDGDYNTYLLIRDTLDTALVIMEHKTTHRLLINTLDDDTPDFSAGETLCGAGFRDNTFVFLFQKADGNFVMRKGQVLFDTIYREGDDVNYPNECTSFSTGNLRLFPTSYDTYYLGVGHDIGDGHRGVYQWVNEYEPYGECELAYINDDVEGLTGFQFEVDSLWLATPGIDFGFAVWQNGGQVPGMCVQKVPLPQFIESKSHYYRIVHEYDPEINKEVVRIYFSTLMKQTSLSFAIGIHAPENNSPALVNLTINKKIYVRIPTTSEETIYLPIHGYVMDSTVSDVYINEMRVPVERNNSFSYNYPIHSSKKKTQITISCTNRIGESTSLEFTVELFKSKNNLWDITFAPLSDTPPVSAQPYEFYTEDEMLRISGYFYGLSGALAGYELYDYVYDDQGAEELVEVRKGIFGNDNNNFTSFNFLPDTWDFPAQDEIPGSGYVYCRFTDQKVELVPGRQLLKIFVENPGGLRTEYTILPGKYPHIIYNLPVDEQRIEIRNLGIVDLDTPYIKEDVCIERSLELPVYEASDLHFKRNYIIEGEVKSLYTFTDMKIKSLDPGVTFDNGETEIIVPVDKINRFLVTCHMTMDDNCTAGAYDLLFIPTKPVFQWMRTGLRIDALKDFRNTSIIPGFTLMDTWSDDELKMGKKLLAIKIKDNRYIPEDTRIRLIVNFTTEISGLLSELEPGSGVYKVKDKTSKKDLYLEGVKPGTNRVQWWISYGNGLISTSTSGKYGMYDYLLHLPDTIVTEKTVIDFPVRLQIYYNNEPGHINHLPDFLLTKDISSTVVVYLNEEILWQDSGKEESLVIDSWDSIPLREGKNYIHVENTEDVKETGTIEFMFLYDSLDPEIAIDSYRFDDTYTYLLEITALVTETNLDRVELYYEDDSTLGISRLNAPVEVIYIGEDMYRVRWYNLRSFNIIPSPDYKVEVGVRDHAGRENQSRVTFEGIKDMTRPGEVYKEKVDISGYSYNRDSIHPYYIDDDGTDPYNGHVKFFNSIIALRNQSAPSYFRHERCEDIFIGTPGEEQYTGELLLRAGESINFNKGFEIRKGATMETSIVVPGVKEQYTPPLLSFPHRQASPGITILFQFRDDDEPWYIPGLFYRRVLTLYDNPDDEVSLYLGKKDDDNRFYLIREELNMNNELECIDLLGRNGIEVTYNKGSVDDWNIVNIGIQELENTIYLSVDDNEQVSVSIPEMDIYFDEILMQDQTYYFGLKDEYRYNGNDTGHFSIARVFYLNDLVETSTALEALSYTDAGTAVEQEPFRTYNFMHTSDDLGSKYYQLRTEFRTEQDHFSPYENANYSEEPEQGSLKVCSEQKNILHSTPGGGVYFTDTDRPLLINLEPDYTVNNGRSMKLTPKTNLFTGKYFFGNKFGTHGLLTNRWYSVSGNIRSIAGMNVDEPIEVKLVMRIDSREQSMVLKEGEFHFVYTNDTGKTLNDVVLYLETDTEIIVDKNIIFNEGNYPLPPEGINGLARSRASTKYIFFPKGSVDFWYKPFNVNNEGYVSYNSVLFDGGYVKLGARIKEGEKYAKYYVELDNNTTFFRHSDVLVTEGWQHIQFTYSRDDDVAYLYINGKMAVKYEGDPGDTILLPEPPRISPGTDNVFLGSDSEGRFFAQGYLDEVHFSNLYYGPRYDHQVYDPAMEGGKFYNKYNPLTVTYTDDPAPALSITLNDPAFEVSDIEYCLDAKDRFFRQITKPGSVGAHGFNMETLTPGAYLLRIKMLINGHRYRSTHYFVKNNRPMFKITEYTPIIITGVNSDIAFELEYDSSYLLNSIESVFAGCAIRISGTFVNSANLAENFVKTYYLVQDFIHQDKHNKKWFINDEEGIIRGNPWQECEFQSTHLEVIFEDITAHDDIAWELRSFYIEEQFDPGLHLFDVLLPEKSGIITDAYFTADIKKVNYGTEHSETSGSDEAKEYEYMIAIRIGNTGSDTDDTTDNGESTNKSGSILDEMGIYYLVRHKVTGNTKSGTVPLEGARTLSLYYDDILPVETYGLYECTLSLVYRGEGFGDNTILALNREKVLDVLTPEEDTFLEIGDFSLLYLDKINDRAKLYLEYNKNNVTDINYDLTVLSTETGVVIYQVDGGVLNPGKSFEIFNNIDLSEGACYIKIKVYADAEGLVSTADLQVVNSALAPSIVLTNSVATLISYNNVMFSWKGYHDGMYKPDIAYSYNFDNKGWTAPTSEWKKIELYNLEEGYHNFRVKAHYNGEESSVESVTFFVDVSRPLFDDSKINVEKIFDSDGIPYAINIFADEGAIVESSLTDLTVNGIPLKLGVEGSFAALNLPLEYDGMNRFVITAYDRVGNFSDHMVLVNNPVTAILYPSKETPVLYSPLVLVGELNNALNVDVEIYLFDPMSGDRGVNDYTGWRHAKINEDRKFFIEDIYINPGTSFRETTTPLEMKVIVGSGHVFTRYIEVKANRIVMPIEMTLSTHAVQGETVETEVVIACIANVEDISSWSIDFDGDGIYDDVKMVDNPTLGTTHTWTHTYSSLGLVQPRVRVITNSGNYFSVTDRIIIHERIKEASTLTVPNPVGMTSVVMEDKSRRIFILAGEDQSYSIEVVEVGRNETYISDRLFTISLEGLGIDNPVSIKALDENTLFLASNRNGYGRVYLLKANEYDNYRLEPGAAFGVIDEIKDIECGGNTLYISLVSMNTIVTVPLTDGIPDIPSMVYREPILPGGEAAGSGLALAKDDLGLLAADYYRQRVLRISESFKVIEFTGTYGNGEGQFLKPDLIESFENRICIYDESRGDIQIMDPLFRSITTIAYDPALGDENYLSPEFLVDIAGMEVVVKEENNRIYYYVLLLSRQAEKLAMLRLPQWEELRARVRSNKIVFLKDREVLTAKPTGSDLAKIITTDSIPRIEGTVDYPSISPDGRKIVFTSRRELYDGTNQDPGGEGNEHSYDNLYLMDINGDNLMRIPLGTINRYEIERPVFSSNGDRIIFSAKETGKNWQVYIYEAAGGITQLFRTDENIRFPYFSPDDRFIVFTTDYDGDEEIEIVDTNNLNVRISLTSNNCRDSFPVWSRVYPHEIGNPDLDITSKIAFVSERDYHKGVYYTYILQPHEADLRVVTPSGQDSGDDPDSAAREITTPEQEGDYPCFTGTSEEIVYEFFDGHDQILQKYNHEQGTNEGMNLPPGSRKPAGMKNSITNFAVLPVKGNEVSLAWTPYIDNSVFYTLQYRLNREGEPFVQKKVFTKGEALLQGLTMGAEYLFKVSLVENGVEEAGTHWKKVTIPEVAARPSYAIDPANPYLVKLHAWKPDEDTEWKFIWIIDNQEISIAQTSRDLAWEFGTSGLKIVQLKTTNKANTATAISDPLFIDIKTDIKPVIEYTLIDSDTTYIELNAENSIGNKIDLSSASWTISGPGVEGTKPATGSKVIVSLNNYRHKVNVNLKLRRKGVTGQQESDVIEKNIVVDLDLKEVKPVITYEADEKNNRLFYFSGNYSMGNIDWYRARWNVYSDGQVLQSETGLSSFAYEFPTTAVETNYSVSLSLPGVSDGKAETTSVMVAVEPAPIEPVIDYEILELREDGKVVGAKILFSCSGSRGNNIDFGSARWSVPVAGTYNEQPTQIGPTAIYNLFSGDRQAVVEVTLTLTKRGNSEPVTVTKIIQLKKGETARTEVVVNKTIEENENGMVVVIDILSSTGPNIDWEKTEWLVDGQYTRKGPAVRYDIPANGDDVVFSYTVTVYTYSTGDPIVTRGEIVLDKTMILPFISSRLLSEDIPNVYYLSVSETPGVNIDWERTRWYIYDGNENVQVKQGSRIAHAFTLKDDTFGYPVMVEMFYKGSSVPFVGYTSIDVEGDDLIPVITWDRPAERGDENVVHFSAQNSSGSNIDWAQCKWTFGDSSESQYGPTAVHKYPVDGASRDYRVSVTLIRRSANGAAETKTAYKTIVIGSDEIKPVVKAKMMANGFLMLSAEESEGRGLMLDRSLWIFEGEGDTQTLNINEKTGVVRNESYTNSSNDSGSMGFEASVGVSAPEWGGAFSSFKESFGVQWSDSSVQEVSTTSHEGFKDMTQSFSSQNMHTGAICRKYVIEYDTSQGKWRSVSKRVITVTLFVYRVSPTGGMTGRSVTVRIDLDEAASGNGVVYK